jgi:hypothetical protein
MEEEVVVAAVDLVVAEVVEDFVALQTQIQC